MLRFEEMEISFIDLLNELVQKMWGLTINAKAPCALMFSIECTENGQLGKKIFTAFFIPRVKP